MVIVGHSQAVSTCLVHANDIDGTVNLQEPEKLLLLFGGGGLYLGGPIFGGGALGLILVVALIVYLAGSSRGGHA